MPINADKPQIWKADIAAISTAVTLATKLPKASIGFGNTGLMT